MVAVLAATLCFTGCGAKRESLESDSPDLPTALVRIQTIESKPEALIEEVVGTVRAKRHATLEAKLSGRIEKLPVVLGQHVSTGELLALLNAPEIVARLDQAQASLEQAESEWNRISKLFEQQAATRADYEAAQARYRIAKGAAAEARAIMSYVEVVAPFDGVVTKKWVDVGDLGSPGKPLISIEDPSALQLEADLPQSIAASVERGVRLRLQVDGVDANLIGTVNEIATAADSFSRTFRVKVDLPSQAGLRSGQFARLLVPVGESDSLRVPASAIVYRGQMEIVFVVTKQHAHMHLVKTGKQFFDEIEVLSGLQAGDAVVVSGAEQLTDGQPVETK